MRNLFSSPAELFTEAKAWREKVWGKKVFLRGIVEFSNYCQQNCLYCGLRRDNISLKRYRLTLEEIYCQALLIKKMGIGTIVLQSGEDHFYTGHMVAELIRRIKNGLGLAVTLSLGERGRDDFTLWRQAGADRYLLKMETFDENLYKQLRPGKTLVERLKQLEILRTLDYETGSGIIAGLPGQTQDGLGAEVERLAGLSLDMVSLSPFTPHPETPLGQHPLYGVDDTINLMAYARLLMPYVHLPVTSALSLHGEHVRLRALEIGNVLMPSLTPEKVKADYNIYPGKNASLQSPELRALAMRESLLSAGFIVPGGPGQAWRKH